MFITFLSTEGEKVVARVVGSAKDKRGNECFEVEAFKSINENAVEVFQKAAPYLVGLHGITFQTGTKRFQLIPKVDMIEEVCVFKRTAFYPQCNQEIPYYKGK